MYSEKVMQRFKDPKFVGETSKQDGVGEVGNPACGDVMHVSIEVDTAGVIKDAKFKTFGCCAAIAASDAVCELVIGKTIDEAAKLSKQDIVDYLDGLPTVKVHCSVLGIDALRTAIQDYKKKLDKKKH
jgi:nitrogen fixation NifU-like protein